MAKEGNLPPRDDGRTKAAAPLEHGASSEILPVEENMGIQRLTKFILFHSFSYNLIVFPFYFCYNLFVPF